jgi:transcriptional regulator with XRE-family HTH domain
MTGTPRPAGSHVGPTGRRMNPFGAWLADAIDRRGITAYRLADEIGYSRSSLTALMYQESIRPRLETVLAIAEALDLSVLCVIEAAGYCLPRRDRR